MAATQLGTSFSLYAFKNKIQTGVRPNIFKITIPTPPGLGGARINTQNLITVLCKSGQLPASTQGVVDVPFRGRSLKIPGDRSFESWRATFYNDPTFELRTFFEEWTNYANVFGENAGDLTPDKNFADITIEQLGKDNPAVTSDALPVLRTYKLIGAWPSNVSAIDLDYDTKDQIETFDVTFEYQYYQIGGGNNEKQQQKLI